MLALLVQERFELLATSPEAGERDHWQEAIEFARGDGATLTLLVPAVMKALLDADLLHGDEVLDPRLVGVQVDHDLGDVRRPGVGRVGVAAVKLVVPVDRRRRLVLALDPQGTDEVVVGGAGGAVWQPARTASAVSAGCSSVNGIRRLPPRKSSS